LISVVDYDEKVASSLKKQTKKQTKNKNKAKHAQFKTRVQKPDPINDQNG